MPHTGGDTLRAVWARTCESRETALTAALDGIASRHTPQGQPLRLPVSKTDVKTALIGGEAVE